MGSESIAHEAEGLLLMRPKALWAIDSEVNIYI